MQVYETTVLERGSRYALTFMVLPAATVDAASSLPWRTAPFGVLEDLGLAKKVSEVPASEDALRIFILDILANYPSNVSPETSGLPSDLQGRVVNYFIESSLVPTECSPLEKRSLISLISASSAGGAAAFTAYVDGDPALILVGAFGIVVIGAAIGLARGLEEGLRQRVLRWLGASPPVEDSE